MGAATAWHQAAIALPAAPRGVHLVTSQIERALSALPAFATGLAHLFLQHTSASLAIGENAAPEVRADLERWLSVVAPDGAPYFRHTDEGPDDMPAHAKNAMLGCSLTLPIRAGRLALGAWQGIYLCEHRDHGGQRHLLLTVMGAAQAGAAHGR